MNFEAAPKSAVIEAGYDDARFYCMANIEGKTGWRLPTRDELNQIYLVNRYKIQAFDAVCYWTCTPYNVLDNPDFDKAVWTQDFRKGFQTYCIPGKNNIPYNRYFVLPVRDLKDNS